MAIASNPRCQGAKIALAKVRRAQELMNAFQRVSVKPKNK